MKTVYEVETGKPHNCEAIDVKELVDSGHYTTTAPLAPLAGLAAAVMTPPAEDAKPKAGAAKPKAGAAKPKAGAAKPAEATTTPAPVDQLEAARQQAAALTAQK